ncbi:MAG TPA: secondary thiamine-phosphate synthase enzyme YjbQ [Solimonas sp.]|nr:secondary thiamine-phosphate synthase enzyme YjbQ [Solimonas sp.]
MTHLQQHSLSFATRGRGFQEITTDIARLVAASGIRSGLCQLFLRHTSASICITENAAPEVRADLERWISGVVPDGDPRYAHVDEGPDDMPAHVRNLLGGCQLTVPLHEGRLGLGTWQGIYLWEHRRQGHRRELLVTLWGE